MESFVNISVLECNRSNSEEAKTGNNENTALWHNKLGSGITINPGDKIQVEQAFINEVGAGDQIIEFLGNSLNAQNSITYLTQQNTNASELIPQGYEQISYTTTTEQIDLYDNKASMVINYFKSANGENYIQMPRKFTCMNDVINNVSVPIRRQVWNAQECSENLGSGVGDYGSMGGLPFHQVPYFVRNSRVFYYCDADYYYYANNIQDHEPADVKNKGEADFFKLRNNGEKYTIFVRKDNYFLASPGYGMISMPDIIETFANASGSSTAIMTGFNEGFFINGQTGATAPGQIGGGAKVALSGCGTSAYNGFKSNAEPYPTTSYFLFTGNNTRYLRTKDITSTIKLGGKITISWIKGNSSNGGETADTNENLEFKILTSANALVSNTIIALGGGTPYPDNIFSISEYTLTAADIATGAKIAISQPTSSAGNFDVYGVKYLRFDTTPSPLNQINLKNVYGTFLPDQYLKINGVMTSLTVLSWDPLTNRLNTRQPLGSARVDGVWVEAYDTKDTIYAPSWPTTMSNQDYLEYTERLDIEIPIGRNSPLNVANDITRQLRQTGSFNQIYYNRDLNQPDFTPQRAISGFIESNTYKIFNAMNAIDMNNLNYDAFNVSETTGSGPPSQPNASALTYINALQFIGVKRPDLYTLGRDYDSTLDLRGGNGKMIINSTIATTDNGGYGPSYIPTNIFWSEDNLLKLKKLFDLQSNYPELFKAPYNDYGNSARDISGSSVRSRISVDTNRFLHINPYRNDTTGAERNILGTDDISASGSEFDDVLSNFISLPLYFYWDKSKAEVLSGGENASNLAYGFAYKQRVITGDGAPYDAISFYTGDDGGYQPPLEYFEYNGSAGAHDQPSPGGTTILEGTRIGWDQHWTAFSTCIIALCDGYVDYPYIQSASDSATNIQPDYENLWKTGINAVWSDPSGITASPASYVEQIKKVYLGANEPLLNFDTDSGRFNFSQLHTPEYIGNDIRAGSTPSASDAVSVPIDPNADNKVYKINKRITNTNWTTAMIPYSCNFVQSASGTAKYDLPLMNVNFDQFNIFDSKSGIVIKEFGYPENKWATGLWGILGFTYNQFNSKLTENNTYNTRITEKNMAQLSFATTNADITSGQSIEYITNEWGVPLYNQQVPGSFCWYGVGRNTSLTQVSRGTRQNLLIQNFPPITEIQQSIMLVAQNLPRKMLKPYFCIRSDLIDMAHYIGGEDSGQILPVCAIINKINGYGDYYFSNDSPLIFTATQRRTITSITTSIHYPDQKYAVVDRDSAIIYKLERNQLAHSNILEEILSKTNKNNIKK